MNFRDWGSKARRYGMGVGQGHLIESRVIDQDYIN